MKTLKQIGEFGLIEKFAKKVKVDKSVFCGIGDDTAVISFSKDKYLLLTTDMLTEGTHFRIGHAAYYQIGRKALAVNISDIAAMGGVPNYALVSIGIPEKLNSRAVDSIMRGINDLACEYKINIVGGDTIRCAKLTLSISLTGTVKKHSVVLRSGARPDDLIFVTGSLGNSRILKQFNFIPRVNEAQDIIKKYKPTAMIDISDGLASDLKRITEASCVGAVIFSKLIPRSHGASIRSALYEGEDFELLFTVPLKFARKFYRQDKFPITCIGKIVNKKEGLSVIDRNAKLKKLKNKGFKHF